jgi:hypothetical protein
VTDLQIRRKDAIVLMLSTLGDAWAQEQVAKQTNVSSGAGAGAGAGAGVGARVTAGDAAGSVGTDVVGGVDDAHADAATVPKEGALADSLEENDEVEIISKQIETADALLEEAEPFAGKHNGIVSDLRGYQKQSLSWMKDRESLAHQSAKGGMVLVFWTAVCARPCILSPALMTSRKAWTMRATILLDRLSADMKPVNYAWT